ncbi:MAG: phospholipase D family protein [Gammaproteobacteria bacterium]|nr:phospholipase D family protein [Gammaproteobacteria bacterium]
MALDHGTVRVAGADRIASRSVKPSTAFHPKVYAFHLDDQTCNLLITSANLTARGFTVNTEAGWPQLGVSSSQVAAAFSRLCQGTQPLSVEVLDAYDEYPNNFVIGRPRLRMGNRQWVDRPLTWHGNNRMERLNLPTQAQGGPDYSSSVVRFRRLPDDCFELAVTPLDSDIANAWKHASSENGNLFRLAAQASARLVGLL